MNQTVQSNVVRLINFYRIFTYIGDYPVEYLEGEYMSNFVDEIAENENQVAGSEKTKGRTRRTATKRGTTESRAKRSYPYRCKKCGKRFVYKEVYEAHMRIHKGLPGFT